MTDRSNYRRHSDAEDIGRISDEIRSLAEEIKKTDREHKMAREVASAGNCYRAVNWNRLIKILGEEPLAKAAVKTFYVDNIRRIELLRQAMNTGSLNQVRSLAHALKNSSEAVAVEEMSRAAAELEQKAKASRLKDGWQALEIIEAEYIKLQVLVSTKHWREMPT